MDPTSRGKTLIQTCNTVDELLKLQHPTDTDFYQYRSLANPSLVRYIVLEPSTDPQYRISCRMLHGPIHRSLYYEALSYTWGTDMAIAPIFIDDHVVLVRYNLFQSLKHLRSSTEPRVLWIDALCIDQSNVTERSSQVAQMTQIYSGADRVIVWLCESNEFTDSAMNWLEEITLKAKALKQREGNATNLQPLYDDWVDLFSLLHRHKDSDGIIGGLVALFETPWWTRVWTLQEIALAREARVQVGRRNISWECFEIVSMLCTGHAVHVHRQRRAEWSELYRVIHPDLQTILVKADTIRIIRSKWGKLQTPLSLMVELTKTRHASDPRDKIYGVLGLVSAGRKPNIDYRLTCVQVYKEAFKIMLESFRDLRVYNYTLHFGTRRTEGLPSWVPDFAVLPTGSRNKLSSVSGALEADEVESKVRGLIYFAASLLKRKLIRSRIKFDIENSRLILKGLPIDAIDAVGVQSPETSVGGQAFHPVILQWRSMLDWRRVNYIGDDSQEEAFWRTILLDCKVIGYHPEITLRNNPRDWHRRLKTPDESIPPPNQASAKKLLEALDRQILSSEDMQSHKSFVVTGKGYMGMAPPTSQKGDIICVLFGGEVPYVLRPVGDDVYQMIGQCYLHGFMDGEAIRGAARSQFIFKDFNIC